jgi:hypothetical protein
MASLIKRIFGSNVPNQGPAYGIGVNSPFVPGMEGDTTPRELPKVPAAPKSTLGVGGQIITGGFLQSNESDARLQGRRKYSTFSDMLTNTSIVAAGTRYYLNLVTKARWKLETADDKPETKKYAELTESVMNDMLTPWHQAIRRAAMYRFYGFSIQEWTAKKRDDGNMGFMDCAARPQNTIWQWFTDQNGRMQSVVQWSPANGLFIGMPRNKLVYVVDDTLANTPEGWGLFRHCVEPAFRLQQYRQLEGWGFEADLHGTPVGHAPFATLNAMVTEGVLSPDDRAALLKPVTDFITGHLKGPTLGLLLDSEMYRAVDEAQTVSTSPKWKMDVLRTGLGGTIQESGKAIDRLNHEIARILGCEHLLMGGNDRGSYALSKDKTANFYLQVDSAIQEISACFTRDWLQVLWALNGWPQDMIPKFKPETLKFSDVDQIASALRDMATAGAVIAPDDPCVNDVRDILGISRVPNDFLASLADVAMANPHIRGSMAIDPSSMQVPGAVIQPEQATPPPPAAPTGGMDSPSPGERARGQGPDAALPDDTKKAIRDIAQLWVSTRPVKKRVE